MYQFAKYCVRRIRSIEMCSVFIELIDVSVIISLILNSYRDYRSFTCQDFAFHICSSVLRLHLNYNLHFLHRFLLISIENTIHFNGFYRIIDIYTEQNDGPKAVVIPD